MDPFLDSLPLPSPASLANLASLLSPQHEPAPPAPSDALPPPLHPLDHHDDLAFFENDEDDGQDFDFENLREIAAPPPRKAPAFVPLPSAPPAKPPAVPLPPQPPHPAAYAPPPSYYPGAYAPPPPSRVPFPAPYGNQPAFQHRYVPDPHSAFAPGPPSTSYYPPPHPNAHLRPPYPHPHAYAHPGQHQVHSPWPHPPLPLSHYPPISQHPPPPAHPSYRYPTPAPATFSAPPPAPYPPLAPRTQPPAPQPAKAPPPAPAFDASLKEPIPADLPCYFTFLVALREGLTREFVPGTERRAFMFKAKPASGDNTMPGKGGEWSVFLVPPSHPEHVRPAQGVTAELFVSRLTGQTLRGKNLRRQLAILEVIPDPGDDNPEATTFRYARSVMEEIKTKGGQTSKQEPLVLVPESGQGAAQAAPAPVPALAPAQKKKRASKGDSAKKRAPAEVSAPVATAAELAELPPLPTSLVEGPPPGLPVLPALPPLPPSSSEEPAPAVPPASDPLLPSRPPSKTRDFSVLDLVHYTVPPFGLAHSSLEGPDADPAPLPSCSSPSCPPLPELPAPTRLVSSMQAEGEEQAHIRVANSVPLDAIPAEVRAALTNDEDMDSPPPSALTDCEMRLLVAVRPLVLAPAEPPSPSQPPPAKAPAPRRLRVPGFIQDSVLQAVVHPLTPSEVRFFTLANEPVEKIADFIREVQGVGTVVWDGYSRELVVLKYAGGTRAFEPHVTLESWRDRKGLLNKRTRKPAGGLLAKRGRDASSARPAQALRLVLGGRGADTSGEEAGEGAASQSTFDLPLPERPGKVQVVDSLPSLPGVPLPSDHPHHHAFFTPAELAAASDLLLPSGPGLTRLPSYTQLADGMHDLFAAHGPTTHDHLGLNLSPHLY